MKHFWIVAMLFVSSFAAAQVPSSGNVYFGYTYYNTDLSLNRGSLNGWQGTLEGKVFPMLGIVADLTGHYGTLSFNILCPPGPGSCGPVRSNSHVYEAMFGPRVSFPVGRFRPFAEFEVGVAHATTGSAGLGTDTSFATALGGGIDYRLFHPVAWRVEGDYVRTDFFHTTQGNFRFSTGIVFRF
ncbi:MAG: outer membrane beta-barrel protein [Candidatus Sulfotelmatobacter sp.]